MKKILSAFAFLAAVSLTSSARAATSEGIMNEVTGGTNAALVFGSNLDTGFAIQLGYSRTLLADMLQGTFLGSFAVQSSTSSIVATAGPTFNLPMDNTGIANAAYLQLTGGIANTNLGTATTYFAYDLQVGKRFSLYQGFTWKPAFGMSGITASGSDPVFAVIPVQFSLVF